MKDKTYFIEFNKTESGKIKLYLKWNFSDLTFQMR